ncbi:protein ANKUB1 isoform X2 [Protopterus annectens]|uniref:protein ANKUB1 isoform X2 n=1 Tax=Protopterus annectens TaxID=7888 RepID=UPI001CFA37E1|nr:protein ANKUB1 isoform X2 [Protopterus annectens]
MVHWRVSNRSTWYGNGNQSLLHQKDYFHIQLADDKKGRRYLELVHAGAELHDDWVLADVGVTPCSTIKCILKEEEKPILRIYNVVTRETVPIMGNIFLLTSTVADLKTLVSLKCGFPVSVFRLSTPWGKELYNCNKLEDYNIDVGSSLRLDVWNGWKEFLNGCHLGHRHTVQLYLSEKEPVAKFQKRVALYIAAFFGHLDLTDWLLMNGTRPEEPVGVHPYREWCQETDHPDVNKCPVHAAAETGQLLTLKAFVNNNILCLECRNLQGLTPLKICVKHKHVECVLYFATKMWSVVTCNGISLPVRVLVKTKQWLVKARIRLLVKNRFTQSSVFRTRVGDLVLIDGFMHPEMTSKPNSKVMKNGGISKSCILPAVTGHDKLNKKDAINMKKWHQSLPNLKLPSIEKDNAATKNAGVQHTEKEKQLSALPIKCESMNKNIWKTKVPLPPISKDTNPRPQFYYTAPNASFILTSSLESFSHHSGRTPRENAIYCLALASAFKEKPWLQQLEVARCLARKTVLKPMS